MNEDAAAYYADTQVIPVRGDHVELVLFDSPGRGEQALTGKWINRPAKFSNADVFVMFRETAAGREVAQVIVSVPEGARIGWAELLRHIPVDRMQDEVDGLIRTRYAAVRKLNEGLRVRAGKRKHYGDYELASIASLYVEAVAAGAKPAKRLAEVLYHSDQVTPLSPGHVRDLVNLCRRRGFLTRTEPGVAGGELTDKAREVLVRTPAEPSF